jgi:hypothetical protein
MNVYNGNARVKIKMTEISVNYLAEDSGYYLSVAKIPKPRRLFENRNCSEGN